MTVYIIPEIPVIPVIGDTSGTLSPTDVVRTVTRTYDTL